LKVAIVTRYPRDPEAPRGGVESVSVNLVRSLARRDGMDVHVVTTDEQVTEPAVTLSEGVPVHRLPVSAGHVLSDAIGPGRKRMHAYLESLAPDVVHSHDVYGLMVKGLRVPRVFTIHGFIHADTLVSGSRLARLRSWIWRFFEVAGWRDQPHIISISPYVRERLSGLVPGRIHDIDNPVADTFFEIVPRREGASVFSAALIEPRKNTLGLVEAFARVVSRGLDARLLLAGSAREGVYGRRVEERIRALGLGEKVRLLGAIPSPRVREELATASVFALVSLEENSPMGIEEAMAAGVPVVTSNRCGMPYMVRDGESGFLVDPHDLDEVARRLGEILGSEGLRTALAERSRQIARDRFHPEAVAARTAAVYAQAIESARR
jgi:glycosyltransferase involved in cell wall biosynthesis